MKNHDDAIQPSTAAAPLRGDVLSARSRMRTKYGSQLQILQVAEALDADEKLLMMAVATGPTQPDRHNHGLLALTDSRLIFVTRSESGPLTLALTEIHALFWSKTGRTGALTVMGSEQSPCFSDMANADGRELMAAAVRADPRIRRVEQP